MDLTSLLRRAALPALGILLCGAAVWKALGLAPFAEPTARDLAAPFVARLEAELGEESGADASKSAFRDVTRESGAAFTHDAAAHGDLWIPEQMGPGVGWLDFDGDGDLDLFVTGGGALEPGRGQQSRLFRNDGGTFSDATRGSGAGVAGPAYGVAAADYDDDGDTDLFVTRLGSNVLIANQGNGTFRDVTDAAGVRGGGLGMSAVFFDYDRDGRLDLYVTRYLDWSPGRERKCFTQSGRRDYCNPTIYELPTTDLLYRNLGSGRFADVSASAGIASERGNGLGVVACDFDADGWEDLYVANDQTPAFLWRNRRNGTFENVAEVAGAAYSGRGVAIAGMGIACEDFDTDGDFDLVVTNIRSQPQLALRNAGGMFTDVTAAIGLAWSAALTGFGVALFDADHDGGLDGFIAAGDVNLPPLPWRDPQRPYAAVSRFLRYEGGQFRDVSAAAGAEVFAVARAAAPADYDNDGDIDLAVTANDGELRLLRNERAVGNWLQVDARTAGGRRAAIGATVTVRAGGRTLVRGIRPQQSYLSSGDARAHFGLGTAASAEEVLVRWPDGTTSRRAAVPANRVLVLRQGEE